MRTKRPTFLPSSSVPTAASVPGVSVAMDSIPAPIPLPTPTPALTPSVSASISKLPDPNPSPGPNVDHLVSFPPITTTFKSHSESGNIVTAADQRPPPFKFPRKWTERDELRFLQGLIDCRFENLSFPRDLNVFYSRFSDTMSDPYTKSQLSDKLRRLRKKYRVISTRLSNGLDQSLLSPHDLALYELSCRLWHSNYADSSPFAIGCGNSKLQKSDLVGVQVKFSPTLSVDSDVNLVEKLESLEDGYAEVGLGGEKKRLSEVSVEFEEEEARELKLQRQTRVENSTGERALVAKAIINAFDESLKEVKKEIVNGEHGSVTEDLSMWSFRRRWQEQRLAEMEALGRRVRLIFENSLI